MKSHSATATKPLLRGHFHQAAFFISLGSCSMLIAKSSGNLALLSTLVYSFSLIALFGCSALYHRPQWSPKARAWMKRIDHAAIFILIAGTVTPLCLLAISSEKSDQKFQLLGLVWIAACLGILQSLFWVSAPKWVSAILYLIVGWLAFPYLPEIRQGIGDTGVLLIVAGGIVYSVGAVIYALKKPNPYPKYFGYHEIFHLLVMIAAALHFLAINRLIV